MNILYNIFLVIIWAPITFLLHNALHEGAHGIAVTLSGAKVDKIWLLPSNKLGYFTFAHITWKGNLTRGKYIFVLVAPLIMEAVWLSIFIPLTIISFEQGFAMPIKLLFLCELTSSVIDATVWGMGWIRNRQHTDGGRVRTLLFRK